MGVAAGVWEKCVGVEVIGEEGCVLMGCVEWLRPGCWVIGVD